LSNSKNKNRLGNLIKTDETSSFIKHVAFDPEFETKESFGCLEICTPTRRYRYYGVDSNTFADFITRDSTGKAYNEMIKGKFKSRRMPMGKTNV